jgi:V8-like Glu-specific endopeptidase
MEFSYLSDEQVREVRRAVLDLGLADDDGLRTLAAGINRAFINGAMVGANPNAKLLNVVTRLNSTKMLLSGEVPFEKWLNNAIEMAGEQEEKLIFLSALDRLSDPDVDSSPRKADGSLEIVIGEDDTLGVEFLVRGAACAQSVARVRVHRHVNGVKRYLRGDEPDWGMGTGWMIGPRLLITNYHVVEARKNAEGPASDDDFHLQVGATEVEFDYSEDGAAVTVSRAVSCESEDFVLDYAVLRLDDVSVGRLPLRLRRNPIVRPPEQPLQERVNVLQHPIGGPMKLAFRDNFVITGEAERLSYLTDTAGGSSGSPIFDDAWHVAGLHRGWRNIEGNPVKVWGKDIRQENYGTPIGLILAHLAANSPDVHEEIRRGQQQLVS